MAMYVGVCHLTLSLPDVHSLKGKRQIVKSLVARLQHEFNISVAEVDQNDVWQVAGIGICCVSNSKTYSQQLLYAALEFIERTRPDLEVIECEMDVQIA